MASTMRPTTPPSCARAPFPGDPPRAGIIAVDLDACGLARLEGALRYASAWLGSQPVQVVCGWPQAFSLAAKSLPAAAVFDPFAADSAPEVQGFASAHPGVRLVAYGRLGPGSAPRLLTVLRAGIHAFVTRDVDDTEVGFTQQLRRAGVSQRGMALR
jgi:hypothetical protein